MVNGKFKCMGGVQHIKSRSVALLYEVAFLCCSLSFSFGTGYLLMAKVKPTADGKAGDTKGVKAYIEATFPGASFDEEHYGEVHYIV